MDHVLAKVTGEIKTPFFKLVSDQTLYKTININVDDFVLYSPDHNLDEDSWFKVENFKKQPFCIDMLKKNFDSKNYADLTKSQFSKIAYLFSVQGKDFYFQKITPSLFLRRKMLVFGETATVEKSENRLVVNALPDAVYFKDLDTLVFKNLATIASIFPGIDNLYKEATQAEVVKFLNEPYITLDNDYAADKVSKPNRKRIALAMATLATMSDKHKAGISNYINQYCEKKLTFNKKDKKFKISTDNELKLLLFGIEERFYTTPFGKEKRLSNSVRAV